MDRHQPAAGLRDKNLGRSGQGVMPFDEWQFRDALAQFATGIAVVTSLVDGLKITTTVSSFNAVCLRPLVLFSNARTAQSFDLWQRAEPSP
jgi:flavin reductase (DIM6/NTAB) family NADH-FMN oxidoreductase RutF